MIHARFCCYPTFYKSCNIERGSKKRKISLSVTRRKNSKRLKNQKITSDDQEQFEDCAAVKPSILSNSPDDKQERYVSLAENSSGNEPENAEKDKKERNRKRTKKTKQMRKTKKRELDSSESDLSDDKISKKTKYNTDNVSGSSNLEHSENDEKNGSTNDSKLSNSYKKTKSMCNLNLCEKRGNKKSENSSRIIPPSKKLKTQKTTSNDYTSTEKSLDESSDSQENNQEKSEEDCEAATSNMFSYSPEDPSASPLNLSENSSDFNCSEAENADEVQEKRKKEINKKCKQYKRLRKTEKFEPSTDSQLYLIDEEVLKFKVNAAENHEKKLSLDVREPFPQVEIIITDSELVEEHPKRIGDGPIKKKGRKDIRRVLDESETSFNSRLARQQEIKRAKRLQERNEKYNEMYNAQGAGEVKVEKLVLDLDEESKKELVVVHEELVKRLKPHQVQGIKFMWDACYESLKQIEKSEGSGCIIAHCMGLGKTFQVVTLIHTLIAHEETGVNTIMVVCPLSTVLNWVNEFKIWLKHVPNADEIEIYELTKLKKNVERRYMLESWQKTGGVLILGYEMFRNLTSTGEKMRKATQESIIKSLVDPGADLVICDEGHLLKNEDSAISKAMNLVKTQRRILLTGTPLQNNLKEYHSMVQFVKPNLLGTKKEFLNRFINPITNGQFDDSTPYDVKLMKKRAYVLHKILECSVQRFDYSVLMPFVPPKQEYVIFVRLSDVQIKMYQHYIDNFERRYGEKNESLLADFQALQGIWTHPYILRLKAAKDEIDRFEASNSKSDVRCFDSDTEKKPTKLTRSARINARIGVDDLISVPTIETTEESAWWSKYVEEEHFNDMRLSTKLMLLFGILKECEHIGDKVLVFSQSLYSLTLIEQFLNLIDQESQNENRELENLGNHSSSWALGLDYFRLDGSTSPKKRSAWCKIFNSVKNTRARLFLISTRAGGLGINLTAANRVIIFDASWNPSHDVQSIFRVYRFGQKKPCYIYRFLAAGTMEEKIYNRQVTKLSLACRVVDEQQIERHYSNNDLADLYQFETYEGKLTTLASPKDRLLAKIFSKYGNLVYMYHVHDSLLENKEEEDLNEEERKQAWLEYEEEKHSSSGQKPLMNLSEQSKADKENQEPAIKTRSSNCGPEQNKRR